MASDGIVVVAQGTVITQTPNATVYATVTAVQYPPGYPTAVNTGQPVESVKYSNQDQRISQLPDCAVQPVATHGVTTLNQQLLNDADMTDYSIKQHWLYKYLKYGVTIVRWLRIHSWRKLEDETASEYQKKLIYKTLLFVVPALLLLENIILDVVAFRTNTTCDKQLVQTLSSSFIVGTVSLFPLAFLGVVHYLLMMRFMSFFCIGYYYNGFCLSGAFFLYGSAANFISFGLSVGAAANTDPKGCGLIQVAGIFYYVGFILLNLGFWNLVAFKLYCPSKCVWCTVQMNFLLSIVPLQDNCCA
jgi:hypothetical protein